MPRTILVMVSCKSSQKLKLKSVKKQLSRSNLEATKLKKKQSLKRISTSRSSVLVVLISSLLRFSDVLSTLDAILNLLLRSMGSSIARVCYSMVLLELVKLLLPVKSLILLTVKNLKLWMDPRFSINMLVVVRKRSENCLSMPSKTKQKKEMNLICTLSFSMRLMLFASREVQLAAQVLELMRLWSTSCSPKWMVLIA